MEGEERRRNRTASIAATANLTHHPPTTQTHRHTQDSSKMSLAELSPAQKEEMVVSLSALLLQDSGVDMSAENLEAVIKVCTSGSRKGGRDEGEGGKAGTTAVAAAAAAAATAAAVVSLLS